MADGTVSWSDTPWSDSQRTAAGGPHVSIPTPSGDVVLVDPRDHREDVVRRLLALGISVRTLEIMLPDWSALVRSVVHADADDPVDTSIL